MFNSFPFYEQLDAMDCGPACIRMITKFYGRSVSLEYLRKKTQYGKEGVSMLGLSDAAEAVGLKATGVSVSFDELMHCPLPAILYWDHYHFVVLTPASRKNKLVVADPAAGVFSLNKQVFIQRWLSVNKEEKGFALLLETTPSFKRMSSSEGSKNGPKVSWNFLYGYLKDYRRFFFQVFFGLLIVSIIQLFFPYLTQHIIDTGINYKDLNFVQIVLVAQLALLFSQTVIEFIRNRVLFYISTRINVSILSKFWAKLLRLPIEFFDTKHPGDILQRIGDHHRIETFLTGTALNTLFSALTLVIFSIVLWTYNLTVFIIFIISTVIYFLWILFFLKYRRKLDYQKFTAASQENNATMQLVYGIQEIKLNNAENTYRQAWERLQLRLFKLSFKNLALSQYQQIGTFFINQGKNIFITFIVAKLVIEGQLTLGMMLAIQFIIGQLNSPIEQLISFSQQTQDAKISLERLNDIHSLEDEEPVQKKFGLFSPQSHNILFKNFSFRYPGAGNEHVLKNISLTIPEGKVTAIVGMSGSGKTTLIKLLLRFYENYQGEISIGDINFKEISPRDWRSRCGAVMQDSFIFNDSIRKNITLSNDAFDNELLLSACKIANILPFIESLPMGFDTKLGAEGHGISGGQKQRILIARAVYKNPSFVFLDEATNSLDANNEKIISHNLQEFFKDRTVVVVAHRLSSVQNADRIILFDQGEVAEEGTHIELSLKKGKYYNLVKNQLEIGK